MTDSSGQAGSFSRDNPLLGDTALFGMYMSALDGVIQRAEIRQACDEFSLSPSALRRVMLGDAATVLGAAAEEFDAYLEAKELRDVGGGAAAIAGGWTGDTRAVMRALMKWMSITGVLLTVIGTASAAFYGPMATFAEAGATLLVVAGIIWLVPKFVLSGGYFESFGFVSMSNLDLDFSRSRLLAAVSERELLAYVRTVLNEVRQDRFGCEYMVVRAPGLSEVYDSTNLVPTRVAAQLDELLDRFDGASIGVAGPRGSGKSTLVRQYCDETAAEDLPGPEPVSWRELWGDPPEPDRTNLRCAVAAPVDYEARDFVLHLYATFCRAVIAGYGPRAAELPWYFTTAFWLRRTGQLLVGALWRAVVCTAAILLLLHWKHTVARELSLPVAWLDDTALAVACLGALDFVRSAAIRIWRAARQIRGKDEHALVLAARRHLTHVRYLQTYTSGWSGTLQLPWGNANGQYSRSVAQAEQPHSYPEIVDEFRGFARDVAAVTYSNGRRVFIGIDELDKIGTAEHAEQFLNEIKGVFGIPHVYFLVSVSDDALTAFERRGLPLRNAFDSSFDEIMYVGALSYGESRHLLYRRVIGLSEPFVALCHCLAGALARDVIRAARQVVRVAVALGRADPLFISAVEAEEYGVDDPSAYLLFHNVPDQPSPTLAVITAAVIHDELLRKLRAVSSVITSTAPASATELHDVLHQVRQTLTLGEPILHVVDLMSLAAQGEPVELTALRLDFAAYAYYCATLQEVFTDQLDDDRMMAATSVPPGPGSFDALASARAAFSLDTLLAWRLITQFRKAWSLDTREPGQVTSAEG